MNDPDDPRIVPHSAADRRPIRLVGIRRNEEKSTPAIQVYELDEPITVGKGEALRVTRHDDVPAHAMIEPTSS